MCSVAQLCLTLSDLVVCSPPTSLLCPWIYPGKSTGVGCHFLLQEISPTEGWSLSLLHWQGDSLPLCHLGSPLAKNLNWVWKMNFNMKMTFCLSKKAYIFDIKSVCIFKSFLTKFLLWLLFCFTDFSSWPRKEKTPETNNCWAVDTNIPMPQF